MRSVSHQLLLLLLLLLLSRIYNAQYVFSTRITLPVFKRSGVVPVEP